MRADTTSEYQRWSISISGDLLSGVHRRRSPRPRRWKERHEQTSQAPDHRCRADWRHPRRCQAAAPAHAQQRAQNEAARVPPIWCTVPDVIFERFQIAQSTVVAYDLRHNTVGSGPFIMDQLPAAGERVHCDSTVTLTRGQCTIPYVIFLPTADAINAVRAAGYREWLVYPPRLAGGVTPQNWAKFVVGQLPQYWHLEDCGNPSTCRCRAAATLRSRRWRRVGGAAQARVVHPADSGTPDTSSGPTAPCRRVAGWTGNRFHRPERTGHNQQLALRTVVISGTTGRCALHVPPHDGIDG
jgi:hypothetical protein